MRRLALILGLGFIARSAGAAGEPERRFEAAASLGYAFPAGSSERGARLSDATFGNAALDLGFSYRLSRVLGVGILGRYGVAIPTLCASGSDCVSSLGHDVVIGARARFFLPRVLTADPYADVGMGYEWFASKLVDSRVTSAHSYNGPVLLWTEIGAPFRIGSRWTLGPALGLTLGTFVDSHLEAPGISNDLGVGERSIHAWLSVAGRAAVRF
jgi:hypothetical protein